MTTAQHTELQAIIQRFGTLKTTEIESAFAEYWQPFVLSLKSEDDRVLAFKIFYEWQISQMDLLAKHLNQRPQPTTTVHHQESMV